MHTQNELLDIAKERAGIRSDYALAKALGVKKQTVSTLRNKPVVMNDEHAVELAHLAQLPPPYVLACLHYESAKCTPEKDAWAAMAKLAQGALMSLLLLVIVPLSNDAEAGIYNNNSILQEYVLCAV